MGVAKQLWMEAQDHVYGETEASFLCPKCGELSSGYVELPMIHYDHPEETHAEISIVCCECDEEFDAFATLGEECSIILDEHPEVDVDFEPAYFPDAQDDYEEYLLDEMYFFEQSDEPYPVFIRSHKDLVNLLKQHGSDDGHAPINRMLFAQCFSMFEAYLCDTFLNLVFLDDANQKCFVENHSELSDLKLDFKVLLAAKGKNVDEVIRAQIRKTVKDTLFHNLRKALALYQIFGVSLFPDETQKGILFRATPHRHDCVHRNGYDKDGKRLECFTVEYVEEVAGAMMSVVSALEEAITDIHAEKLKL